MLAAIYCNKIRKFLNVHKYLPKVECPCALRIGSLSYCQSAVLATVAKTAQVEVRTAPYFLFVTAGTDHGHAQKFTESCLLRLELMIEASTRVATIAQKPLPTAAMHKVKAVIVISSIQSHSKV